MVERVMRGLGLRIKKIAYGWSDKGTTKIARTILNGLLTPEHGKTTGKNVWKLSATSLSALEITDVFHKIWDNNQNLGQ